MQDHQEYTGCFFPDCGVHVEKVEAPREPLCFTHIEVLASRINQLPEGPDRDAAIADFRRRVMGLEVRTVEPLTWQEIEDINNRL